MFAGAFTRHPVVWHLHDILSADHFGWLQRHSIAWLSNHLTHAVIVVSAAGRDALIASGGDPSRISIVHNGIDPAPFAGLHSLAPASFRSELGLPEGRLVGLFGRITQWKGQRVLIHALALLPDTQALIVGSPMFGEDAEMAFLKDLAIRLGVAQRVHFLGYRTDTPRLMRAVDLVVHCSTAPEPFGRVIVEALFAGTPILAASGGASAEILGDDPTWLVQPGRPDELAEAIDRILSIEAEALALQLADLRRWVEREFTLDRMMQHIEALVTQAMPGTTNPMPRP
jgi:glycosyltransferase involved in cell wall biosynthesis